MLDLDPPLTIKLFCSLNLQIRFCAIKSIVIYRNDYVLSAIDANVCIENLFCDWLQSHVNVFSLYSCRNFLLSWAALQTHIQFWSIWNKIFIKWFLCDPVIEVVHVNYTTTAIQNIIDVYNTSTTRIFTFLLFSKISLFLLHRLA